MKKSEHKPVQGSMKRRILTTTVFLLIFDDERIATGKASAQPITVPRIDIFIVSNRGLITFGKKLQSGWKIFFSKSSILLKREVITERS